MSQPNDWGAFQAARERFFMGIDALGARAGDGAGTPAASSPAPVLPPPAGRPDPGPGDGVLLYLPHVRR